jgi:Wiskott-Aldrich syndrome protein
MTEPTLSGDTSTSQVPPMEAQVPEHVPVPPSPAPARAATPLVFQPTTPTSPQVHIVSNARGPYPQLEMHSVPRRSYTIGHTQRRGLGLHDEREMRSMQRIMRKLSEVCCLLCSVSNVSRRDL